MFYKATIDKKGLYERYCYLYITTKSTVHGLLPKTYFEAKLSNVMIMGDKGITDLHICITSLPTQQLYYLGMPVFGSS